MLRLCKPLSSSPAQAPKRFIVGVNYGPRRPGAFLGCGFDVDEVQEDFAALSELGIKDARVYLPWSDFHGCPTSGGCLATAHLISLCDAAAAEEVRVELAFFSGHLAPGARTPQWLLPPPEGPSPYFGPTARETARKLVHGVAQVLAEHPAVRGYNLGGLPASLASPDSLQAARQWFAELSYEVRQQDPGRPIAWELEGSDLSRGDGLRIDELSTALDYSVVARSPFERHPSQETGAKPALFACALAAALTGKPSLLQEWEPLPPLLNDSQRLASHAEALLGGLQSQGALGAYLWWFSELSCPSESPSNLGLCGLYDRYGQPRPHASVLRDFAAGSPQVLSLPAAKRQFEVILDEFYANPREEAQRLYAQFEQA